MPILNNSALLPFPPPELAARVAGSADLVGFEKSGRASMLDWANALHVVGKTFWDFKTIVDFGCGCGRVLRHLRPNLEQNQELIGLDVDAEAVDWIRRNYKGISAQALELYPPSSIATNTVDLVVNHSVFTHLPEDVQFHWLYELHRILKPDGIAILTFHGQRVWNDYCSSLVHIGRGDEIPLLTSRFHRRGFHYHQGRGPFESDLPEYYGSAFHTISYIEEEWLRFFRLKAWIPVGALKHQDILVLENTAL